MDSSYTEAGDGPARLSLSLVSYGSDVEDVDSISASASNNQSSDTLVPEMPADLTVKTGPVTMLSFSEEEEIITSAAKQLGFSGVSVDKLNLLCCAVEKMEVSRQKYMRVKMVYEDAVKNAEKMSLHLPPETIQRFNQVLEHISLSDYVSSSYSDSVDGIFGISPEQLSENLPNELTKIDLKNVKDAVKEELALKHQRLIDLNERSRDILSKVSGPVFNVKGNYIERSNSCELISLLRDLQHEITLNKAYLEDIDKILSALVKLKLEAFYRLNSNRVGVLGNKCEVLKTDLRSLNDQVVNQIFTEDQHLVDAHNALKKNLDLAVAEAKFKLSELEKKDVEYDKLKGTQFDRLVKEYQDLMKQISQKEYALKTLL